MFSEALFYVSVKIYYEKLKDIIYYVKHSSGIKDIFLKF